MKENIESRIKELKQQEQNLIDYIANLEKTIIERRASLVSVRGGIIELRLLLKNIDGDITKNLAIIEKATDKLEDREEEE